MGFVVVDLKAAGLTHATGKSDKCDGRHEVDEEFLTDVDIAGLVDAYGLGKVLQALHEQAHPGSSVYWENCLEPACADARELFNAC